MNYRVFALCLSYLIFCFCFAQYSHSANVGVSACSDFESQEPAVNSELEHKLTTGEAEHVIGECAVSVIAILWFPSCFNDVRLYHARASPCLSF